MFRLPLLGARAPVGSPHQCLQVGEAERSRLRVVAQAECFARAAMQAAPDDQARVRFAFRRALNRAPSQQELDGAIEFLRLTMSELKSEDKVWASLCQALLVTNEFRYVD